MSARRDLFGGAITAVLPLDLIDASTIRQVPDTQEVFISPASDVSFILEILQRVEPNDAEDAIRFHFNSIAHDNDATSSAISSIEVTTTTASEATVSLEATTPSPVLLDGSQNIKKFNRSDTDEVQIMLAVYRIQSKDVDLVFSANIPLKTESGVPSPEGVNTAKEAFLTAARTLEVEDFGLFA